MSENPYAPPAAHVDDVPASELSNVEYAGFWIRVLASIVDTVLTMIVTLPLLTIIYGYAYWNSDKMTQGPADILVSWVLPAVAVLAFWIARQATPGKMLVSATIIDAKTGGKPSPGQFVGRYLGYFVSGLPLGLGILWVAFDPKKQGWHDKLAGTVVVRHWRGKGQAPQ